MADYVGGTWFSAFPARGWTLLLQYILCRTRHAEHFIFKESTLLKVVVSGTGAGGYATIIIGTWK
jgi:hypothetical protein